jgi:hypothetical protein
MGPEKPAERNAFCTVSPDGKDNTVGAKSIDATAIAVATATYCVRARPLMPAHSQIPPHAHFVDALKALKFVCY